MRWAGFRSLIVAPQASYYPQRMLRYHVAFYLPHAPGEMVLAEAFDFPGAVTQGFDLKDARLMIASALEDLVITCINRSNGAGVPRAALQLWSTRMAQPFAGTPSQMRQ